MPPANRKKPARADTSESSYSLMEFMAEYPDDDACLEYLWRNRYSEDGVHAECPKCKQVTAFKKYGTSQQRQSWTCTRCGRHLHPTAGTIFHKSSTSLHLWFYAMYLMTSTRCGISAKQLERELGVTYKTAWRMFNLIRHRLMDEDDDSPLGGTIEADEAYIGGRRKAGSRPQAGATYKPRPSRKAPVFGMVERGGRVVARSVPSLDKANVLTTLKAKVLPESVVYTDEWAVFGDLGNEGYTHKRVKHGARVYVDGDVHTNTIEGFWSLVKNGIRGVYHSVSTTHLQGYLNEYAWRYNNRADGEAMFKRLLARAATS